MGGSCLERLPRQLSPTNLAALSGQLSVSVPPQLRAGSWDAFLPAAALTDNIFLSKQNETNLAGNQMETSALHEQPGVSRQ